MSYSPTAGLVRARTELSSVNLDFLNGHAEPNKAGIHYPFPTANGRFREVLEVRAYTRDQLTGITPPLPNAGHVVNFFLTVAAPDGSFIMEDMPLARLSYPFPPTIVKFPRRIRGLIFKPFVADMLQSYVYTTAPFSESVVLELIYR